MSDLSSTNDIAVFAETNYRNERTRFGIKTDDRRRHMYVLGKTGMGKTNLIQNMAIADIQAGRGLGVVDPHGEFVEALLDYIPARRINDVIYINPADLEWPVSFNILEHVDPAYRHLVASGVVGVFKKIWADSWGPRLEYVLRNAILALLEYPGSTLMGTMRILIDKEFRKKVISKVQDPTVRSFWTEEYTKYPDRFQSEAVAPIQNKVGQFLSSPLIRNIVGQTTTAFNLREVIDQKKILLLNLSKGRIGEDASALLGAMMVTKLQLAAMSRVDVPEAERQDFYLYVDEFQNFATESFANILSEARKYRLDLILAHQYITQLPEEVYDAVFGNVGTLITFRVGADDAEFLEKEFMPEFTAQDLVNLGKYNVYLKLMIDGVASKAFSATTLAPCPKPQESFKEKIIRVSRERYSTKRALVEEKIMRWYGLLRDDEQGGALVPGRQLSMAGADRGASGNAGGRPVGAGARGDIGQDRRSTATGAGASLFETVCAHCQKKAFVPFKPDGVRPVYCDECLAKIRSGALIVPPRASGVRVPADSGDLASVGPRSSATEKTNAGTPRPESGRQAATATRPGDRSVGNAGVSKDRMTRIESRPRRAVDLKGLRQVLKETIEKAQAPAGHTPDAQGQSPGREVGKELKPGEMAGLDD